jgi:DNA polymerase-3 subunit chi
MSEVLFYHLEMQPLERVLPMLLEKTIERGWRAVVETSSPERAAALDAMLWTYRDDAFLPHGVAGEETDTDQPVLIATEGANGNGASVRFFVDRAVPQSAEGYERVVYLFSGHDPDAVTEARVAWKALTPGNTLTYWQQDQNGRWVKKAESGDAT